MGTLTPKQHQNHVGSWIELLPAPSNWTLPSLPGGWSRQTRISAFEPTPQCRPFAPLYDVFHQGYCRDSCCIREPRPWAATERYDNEREHCASCYPVILGLFLAIHRQLPSLTLSARHAPCPLFQTIAIFLLGRLPRLFHCRSRLHIGGKTFELRSFQPVFSISIFSFCNSTISMEKAYLSSTPPCCLSIGRPSRSSRRQSAN